MKAAVTISFIMLLIASQYARQFNYLECKLNNAFKAASVQCDCESKDNFSATDKQLPSSKTHTHPTFDEFFTTSVPISIDKNIVGIISDISFQQQPGTLTGYAAHLYRPPRYILS